MQTIRNPTLGDFAKLTVLGAIWGSAFLCIEIALTDFSPFTIAAGRITVATLILVPMVFLKHESVPRGRSTWCLIGLIGFFYNAVPFTLISWGQQYISGGTSAIVMACGPFVALTLSHFFTHDDRFTLPKFFGVVLGFSGVLTLIGTEALDGSTEAVFGQVAVFIAVSCYIISSLIIRRLTNLSALVTSAWVLATSVIYMVPAAFLFENPTEFVPRSSAVAALVFLGIIPTALGYLFRIQIIQQVGTTFLSQVSYLVPLFAVLFGWMFLSEIPSWVAWISLGLILFGMAVSRIHLRGDRSLEMGQTD